MRSLLAACGILLALLLIPFATRSAIPRADFTYVNPSGIHTLDPARMSWTNDFRIALNLWEGLTSWDPQTLDPIGGAAEFPPQISPDALTYTFRIRTDARWSNGDPVTAYDFLRGWRRAIEPGTGTDYTFLFVDHIAGAGDYVRWRRRGVAVLTALQRLRAGWGITGDQAETLVDYLPAWEQRLSAGSESRMVVGVLAPLLAKEGLGEVSGRSNDPPQSPFGKGGGTSAGFSQSSVGSPSDTGWDVDDLPAPNARSNKPLDSTAEQLIGASVLDWQVVYDNVFAAHARALDERFARIGFSALNDRTLVVKLIRPCPYFLDLTGFPAFLPCHKSVERMRLAGGDAPIDEHGLVVYDPEWTKPHDGGGDYPGLITNGAYGLSHWTFKRRLRLTANPYHRFADRLQCHTVDMLVYENVSAAIMAYEAGDVDFLPDMSVPYDHEIARLATSGERPDFHLCNVLATYFFNFNCVDETVDGAANPFVDARVRRAFALAVDKERIVQRVLQRGDRVAHSFVPPGGIRGYDPPVGSAYDPDEARRLLAAAGFPGGEGLGTVDLLYTPNDARICQAIARMWQDVLGADVALRSKESKTFAADKAARRYMIARANWFADYNDPTTFLDCLMTGNGNNDSGYSNDDYDGHMKRARSTADPIQRAAILRDAESIIVQRDLPILPILHYALPIAIKPYVTGLHPNARLFFPFHTIATRR